MAEKRGPFLILWGKAPEDLENRVNEMMREGYVLEPISGVGVGGGLWYFPVMVAEKAENPPDVETFRTSLYGDGVEVLYETQD